jgi:uroporphyrinogen-III decarboxylase
VTDGSRDEVRGGCSRREFLPVEPGYDALFGRYLAEPDEIAAHNAESSRVWEAFRKDAPIRVPADWGGIAPMRLLYADEASSFSRYFTTAEEMLRVQAACAVLNSRIITGDQALVPPAAFTGSLDFHPFSDEAYWGCPVHFFERDQPRVHHLYDQHKVPPEQMRIPDPFGDHFMSTVTRMHTEMAECAKTLTYAGRPFKPALGAGGMKGTYGLFNTAVQLRGTDLFLDMMEDPAYVHGLLDVIARGYVRRVQAWEDKLGRNQDGYNIVYDHGIDMISMDDYERFLVPVYERVKAALGAQGYDSCIEHCGRGEKVIRYKHERFGVNRFTNLNASCLDLERLRHDLGPDVWMQVTVHPGLVHTGPPEAIREAVKSVLTPRLKGKGRLTFGMQFDNFRAPLEHIRVLHEAVKEYGRYPTPLPAAPSRGAGSGLLPSAGKPLQARSPI